MADRMLTIAAHLAFVAAASAAAASAVDPLPSSSLMPLVVNVTAAEDIPRSLVTALLKEADTIWRAAGFRFVWQRGGQGAPANLQVLIGGGTLPPPVRGSKVQLTPIAWIALDERGRPAPKIYVSHASALEFLFASRETVGRVEAMPPLQRNVYLARALGRALAHEVGHYLMGSRDHSARGLMMAVHSSAEFFAVERTRFQIGAAERQRMAARFTSIYMASRG